MASALNRNQLSEQANKLLLDTIQATHENLQIINFLDSLPFPIIITDFEFAEQVTTILYSNAATTALCGYSPGELYNQKLQILQGPATDLVAAQEFRRRLEIFGHAVSILMNYKKDGSPYMVLLSAGKLGQASFIDFQCKADLTIIMAQNLSDIPSAGVMTTLN